MAKATRAVPDGYHTVTPYLTVRGADRAIDFYKRAFGVEELFRMPGPGGELMHAELKIGDSKVFLSDEFPDPGAASSSPAGRPACTLHLSVEDVDAVFKRAGAAGCQVRMPLADMFWGDRYARVADPFGHEWGMATHKEDLTTEEIAQRAAAYFASTGKPKE